VQIIKPHVKVRSEHVTVSG